MFGPQAIFSATSWVPLTPSWMPQYLRGAGLLLVGQSLEVHAAGGRRGSFAVSVPGIDFHIKQFGPSSHEGEHWANEASSLAAARVSPDLLLKDTALRVLVTKHAGNALEDEPLDQGRAVRLVDITVKALNSLDHAPARVDGQRPRIFMLMREADASALEVPAVLVRVRRLPSIVECVEVCWNEWQTGPKAVLHGDLKTWHVFCNSRDDIRLVDWENSLAGHRYWDLGLLAASAFSRWFAGAGSSSGNRALLFARAVLSEAGPRVLPWVVLGALQLAYEGSTGDEVSRDSAEMTQFAVNLAEDLNRAYLEFRFS